MADIVMRARRRTRRAGTGLLVASALLLSAGLLGPSPAAAADPRVGTAAGSGSTPVRPAAWSAPRAVDSSHDCWEVTAGIDAAGRDHVAVSCAWHIRYSSNASGAWRTTVFAAPSGREDTGPAIAFANGRVYVAWTRMVGDAGCGSGTGVFIRSRRLPGGAWSAARRVGLPCDRLYALRASGGTLWLAVGAPSGQGYLESLVGSTLVRRPIEQATGAVALRIGPDGIARFAYEASDGIWFGMYNGSRWWMDPVVGSKAGDCDPVLALDRSNRAHVLFTRSDSGPSDRCAGDGGTDSGTWYATNRGKPWNAWTTARMTPQVGTASLVVDNRTNRLTAILAWDSPLRLFTALPGRSWSSATLVRWAVHAPVALLRQATGALVVVFDRKTTARDSVYLMRRT